MLISEGFHPNRREAVAYSKQFHFSHSPPVFVTSLLLFIRAGPEFTGWIFTNCLHCVTPRPMAPVSSGSVSPDPVYKAHWPFWSLQSG